MPSGGGPHCFLFSIKQWLYIYFFIATALPVFTVEPLFAKAASSLTLSQFLPRLFLVVPTCRSILIENGSWPGVVGLDRRRSWRLRGFAGPALCCPIASATYIAVVLATWCGTVQSMTQLARSIDGFALLITRLSGYWVYGMPNWVK